MSDDFADMREQMMREGSFDPRAFITAATAHGHSGFIGTRYVDHGENWVEAAIDYDKRLIGDRETGILASGPIVSLCDMSSGMAIWQTVDRFCEIVTIDLRIDYLRPARAGEAVTARMECYRATRNIAFVRGQAHDGDADDPIAHATGTFMLLGPS